MTRFSSSCRNSKPLEPNATGRGNALPTPPPVPPRRALVLAGAWRSFDQRRHLVQAATQLRPLPGRVLAIAEIAPLLQRELVDTGKVTLCEPVPFDFVERPEYADALADFQHNIDKGSGTKYRVSVFTAGPGVGKTRFGIEAKKQLQRLVAAATPASAALAGAVALHLPWSNGHQLAAFELDEAPIEYWLGLRMVLAQLVRGQNLHFPSGYDLLRLLHKHDISLQSFAVSSVYGWLRKEHHASALILHLDGFQQLLLPEVRDVRGPRPESTLGEAICRALLPRFGEIPTLLLCTCSFNRYSHYLPLEPSLGEVRWRLLDPLDATRAHQLALQAVPGVATTDALKRNLPLRFVVDALGGIPGAFKDLREVMMRQCPQKPPDANDSATWQDIWRQLRTAAEQRYSMCGGFLSAKLPGYHDRLLLTLAALAGARLDPDFRMPSGVRLREALTMLHITLTADGTIRFPLLWMSAALPTDAWYYLPHLPHPLKLLARYFSYERICTDLTWKDYEQLVVLYVQFRSWLALQHPSLNRGVLDGALPTTNDDDGRDRDRRRLMDGEEAPVESQFVSSAPEIWPLQGRLLPPQFDTTANATTPATTAKQPDVLAVLVGGKNYDGLVVHRLRHHAPLFLWLSCKRWTDAKFSSEHVEHELARLQTGQWRRDAPPTTSGLLHEAAKVGKHVPVLFSTDTWQGAPPAPLRLVDLAARSDYFGCTVAPLVTARSRIAVNLAPKSHLAALLGGDVELADRIEQCRRSAPIADEQQLRRLCPAFPEHLLPLVSYAKQRDGGVDDE